MTGMGARASRTDIGREESFSSSRMYPSWSCAHPHARQPCSFLIRIRHDDLLLAGGVAGVRRHVVVPVVQPVLVVDAEAALIRRALRRPVPAGLALGDLVPQRVGLGPVERDPGLGLDVGTFDTAISSTRTSLLYVCEYVTV